METSAEGPGHALGVAVQDIVSQLVGRAREDGRYGRAADLAAQLLVEVGNLEEGAQSTSGISPARAPMRRRGPRRARALTVAKRLAAFQAEQGRLSSMVGPAGTRAGTLAEMRIPELRLGESAHRVFANADLHELGEVLELSPERAMQIPGLQPRVLAELCAAAMLAIEVADLPRPVMLPALPAGDDLFEGVQQGVSQLPFAERETVVLRTGANDRVHTYQEVGEAVGCPWQEVPMLERRAVDLLLSQPAIVNACWRLEVLCARYGLGWEDERVSNLVESLYPGTWVNFTRLVTWLMREKAQLVADIAGRQCSIPRGIEHFDQIVVATLGRYGSLQPEQLSEHLHAALSLEHQAALTNGRVTERVQILGPAVQGDDGLFRLPDSTVAGVDDRHIRALNGLIGALQKLGSARISVLTTEVNRRLPRRYEIDTEYVRAWLTRHPELFIKAGPDRFKLASLDVDILCGLDNSWSPKATRPFGVGTAGNGSAGTVDSKRYEVVANEIAVYLTREGPQPIWRIRSYLYGRYIGPASADKVVATFPNQFYRNKDGIVSLQGSDEADLIWR